ncbi:MAG: hypothetical protein IID41_03735 [Planctomycetes bacterium]|nr:hypothetical protein [Planctomycetota bacterium]
MNKNDIPEFLQDILYAHDHRLLDDEEGRAAIDVVWAGVADKFIRDLVQERVRRHKIAQAFAGPFRLPILQGGELFQGFDLKGRRLFIPIQYLNAHSLTVAGSGSGKTNKALCHAVQIAPRVAGMWLFDCRKKEFRKIKSHLARLGVDLIELPARALRLNPLQVPLGVEPSDWIHRVADILALVLELPPRASKMLQNTLHRLFRKMGVFDPTNLAGQAADRALYPTLFHLAQAVANDPQANAPARQALLDSLEPLLASLGPEVLAYHRAWPVHELAKYPINIVLSGVPEVAQNLILNTLLLAEFASRVAQDISNPRMDLYISIDEGQRILAKSSSANNALADLWPLIRGTGIGLDISVPSAHALMPEALSLTATKYLGRCGSASDYETIGRSMGMSREQLAWTFHHTRPGRMIAQLGEGEFRFPYVLDIPLLRLPGSAHAGPVDIGALKLLPVIKAKGGGHA